MVLAGFFHAPFCVFFVFSVFSVFCAGVLRQNLLFLTVAGLLLV
jgi:hypothetical protein